MLDFGWSEIALIATLAVIVLGPKELPTAMRAIARWVRKARSLAGDFQRHLDDVVKEAELDDLKKEASRIARTDIGREIDKAVDPDGTVQRSLHIDDRPKSGPTLSLDDRIDPTGPSAGTSTSGGPASAAPAAQPDKAVTKPKE